MLNQLIFASIVATGAVFPAAMPAQPVRADALSAAAYREDFDAAWMFVREAYAYFNLKQTDWDLVRALYRQRAAGVQSKREFVAVLEEMMEELYDPHAHLGINTVSSPRLVPSGSDLWAEWRDGRAILTEVRAGSEAERVGLRQGMEIVSIQGQPVLELVRERLPKSLRAPDPAADDWALRAELAGRHAAALKITARAGNHEEMFEFRPGLTNRPGVPLTATILEKDIGYVRIHDTLGDTALIAAWDEALVKFRSTRALVLDLRDTPSGGNTTVARALMGRLISEEQPYQRHELPAEEYRYGVRRIWVEYVAPRGPFHYDRPVVVLVGRWTGSMGEGITIGLDAMQRATTIGGPMARLLGATHSTKLPHTGIVVRVPAERLYHIRGAPRESFVPSVAVESVGLAEDAALMAALQLLRR